MRRITATLVYWLSKSPFMVWCDLFAPRTEKEPYSAFAQSLMDRGKEFERQYDSTLGTLSHIDFKDIDDGFIKTRKLMKDGADVITGMPLVDAGHQLEGIPDVLVKKTTHKSVFGRHHYVVQEVKSGRELKEEYVLQGAFYHLILGRIQGYTPRHFFIVTMEADGSPFVHKVDFERCEHRLKAALVKIQRIADGSVLPPPNVKECDEPWQSFCLKKAKEQDDISLVANCGTDKQAFLRKAGMTTVRQLAALTSQVDGIADSKLDQLRQCARAFVEGKSHLMQPARIPSTDTELFIDFEGMEIDGEKHEYLLGILERTKGKTSFHAFVAKDPKDEGRMVKEAFAFLGKHPDAPIFHYAPYEKTALKALAERNGMNAQQVIDRLVDLLQVCRRCVAPSTSTFRLKDFGKSLGASWREGMNAAQSMVLYQDYLATKDAKILGKIIDYNEDDVRAILMVKDWLVGNSAQADS